MNFPRRIAGWIPVVCSAMPSVVSRSTHTPYITTTAHQHEISLAFGGILPSTSHFSQNTRPWFPSSSMSQANISVLVHVPMSAASSCRCWGWQGWCQHWSYYEILYILWMKVWECDKNVCFCSTAILFSYQQLAEYFICNFVSQAESPVSVLYAYLVPAGAGRVQLPGK